MKNRNKRVHNIYQSMKKSNEVPVADVKLLKFLKRAQWHLKRELSA